MNKYYGNEFLASIGAIAEARSHEVHQQIQQALDPFLAETNEHLRQMNEKIMAHVKITIPNVDDILAKPAPYYYVPPRKR